MLTNSTLFVTKSLLVGLTEQTVRCDAIRCDAMLFMIIVPDVVAQHLKRAFGLQPQSVVADDKCRKHTVRASDSAAAEGSCAPR